MSAALRNSLIFRFCAAFAAAFAAVFRESLLCRLCAALVRAVPRWCSYSVLVRAVQRALDAIARTVPGWLSGSVVVRFVTREGALSRAWSGSRCALLLNCAVNLPTALSRSVYRKGRDVLEGSVTWRALAFLGQSAALLTGLFLLGMLSVPHAYWNNVYGFVGALVLAALFFLAAGRGELSLEITRLGPWFALFLLSIVSALVTSYDTALSLRFFLFYVGAFLFLLLIVSAIRRVEQLTGLLTALTLGLVVCGACGAYQLATGVEVVASQQDMLVNAGMPGRVYAFFDNPNNFAEVLLMLLPLALALLLVARGWGTRVLALAALALGVLSLGATYSRSGWIGAAVALVVFLALVNWRLLPLAALCGILCVPFLPATIFNRILTIGNTEDTSVRYRFYIYDASFTMLRDFWFRGTGLGSDAMSEVFHLYDAMPDGNYPLHTHNNYLQMWGELGILGGVFHVGLMLGQVKRGVRRCRGACQNREVRIILAAAVGALCGILVVGLAEYTWYYPRNLFFFWSLFGVVQVCVKLLDQPERAPRRVDG